MGSFVNRGYYGMFFSTFAVGFMEGELSIGEKDLKGKQGTCVLPGQV